ncbi:hypothetical protein L7F22_060492 [Adiantum nelumboides]|nr:hypothetical protein [Adiantum nelumboides]
MGAKLSWLCPFSLNKQLAPILCCLVFDNGEHMGTCSVLNAGSHLGTWASVKGGLILQKLRRALCKGATSLEAEARKGCVPRALGLKRRCCMSPCNGEEEEEEDRSLEPSKEMEAGSNSPERWLSLLHSLETTLRGASAHKPMTLKELRPLPVASKLVYCCVLHTA